VEGPGLRLFEVCRDEILDVVAVDALICDPSEEWMIILF